MSPLEHGEVFVLDDGGEVDLDLGNYERYLNVTLTRRHNITTGKVYQHVIESERKGKYLGKTVQVVPHLTNAIQDWISAVAEIAVDGEDKPDVCIIELGGTVGDIESAPFVEALRQFQFRVGVDNFALIHVSLVPVIGGEKKTKPTQAAIKDLRSLGLTPDIIACRCSQPLDNAAIEKISMFCHVGPDQVLGVHDVNSTYHVPLLLKEQKLIKFLQKRLKLDEIPLNKERLDKGLNLWSRWLRLTNSHDRSYEKVTIAIVGKYTDLQDSYISVVKALEHAALAVQKRLEIVWVDSSDLEKEFNQNSSTPPNEQKIKYHTAWGRVCSADGILVPGGFGSRGTEGMISAAKWARENNTPYLGICLGFQIAIIEYTRNVLNVKTNSEELDKDVENPVIVFMPEIDKTHLGGTMRLGTRPSVFQDGTEWSKLRQLYGMAQRVNERHRHRYEVSSNYISSLESAGLHFIARDDTGERMESFELKEHPYYVGTQYHPEYLSKVLTPSKPFLGLVAASSGCLDEVLSKIAEKSASGDIDGDF